MPWTEGIKEGQTVKLAGKEFPVSRVVTEQSRLIELPGGGYSEGKVWELIRKGLQLHNPAFLLMDGKWIKGHTFQRRWSSGDGRPERQNVFKANDGSLTFVVTSERITV